MLLVRAYSFRQQSRLAISLSWIGGFTNVVGLLALGTVVSHVTGTMTEFGRSIGAGSFRAAIFFGWLLLTFLSGAMLSAVMTELARHRGWRSKYILPIALEAILLSIVAISLSHHLMPTGGIFYGVLGLASLAMGLQNATITKISGAVVRTTHLTGIFTDLGLDSVHYLFWFKNRLLGRGWQRARRLMRISRRHPYAQRTMLLASIAGSFGFGACAGYLLFQHLSASALFAPVAFLLWIVYVDLRTPIADIYEMDSINDPELKLLHLVNQLLPHGTVMYRLARGDQAPNFQLWLQRVPDDCRAVILAINPQMRFDTNAILDLEAAVHKLRAQDQTLIISGITRAQVKALNRLGVARMMDMNNLCPDLEFAIARVLAIASPRQLEAGRAA